MAAAESDYGPRGKRGSDVSQATANKEFDKLAASASKPGVEDKSVERAKKGIRRKSLNQYMYL